MKVKSIEEIKAFCEKYAAPLGLSVPKVEFKQGKNPVLTVFIDKTGGVDLDACEAFHRAVYEPMDELDPTFGEPYTLNVSSLGADRPFVTEEDFSSHIGKTVEIRLKSPVHGKKYYEAVLLSYGNGAIAFKVNEKTAYTADMKIVEKVSEYIDFE